MDQILPTRVPRTCYMFCHRLYKDLPLGLFSYMDQGGYLLKRCHISILLHDESDRPNAMYLKEKIITHGGNASVLTTPEVRWNSINLIGDPLRPLPSWCWYLVKFYSIRLLVDAADAAKFDRNNIQKYLIKYQAPPNLNIHYISKLF